MRAREELSVLDEQFEVFYETAEEARIRSLVSETPLAHQEWHEASRHLEAMTRAREAARSLVADLQVSQDELLDKLVG